MKGSCTRARDVVLSVLIFCTVVFLPIASGNHPAPLESLSDHIESDSIESGSTAYLFVLETDLEPGDRVRAIAVSEEPLERVGVSLAGQELFDGSGPIVSGPPYVRFFEGIAPPIDGSYSVRLTDLRGELLDEVEVPQSADQYPASRLAPESGIWTVRQEWDESFELLFSAWIAHLFRPLPEQANRGWKVLEHVLHSPRRNFLHNRLGLNEDDPDEDERVRARADCGDVPYHLRAYFSWKFALPFRFSRCTRGTRARGPRCTTSFDQSLDTYDDIDHPVARLNTFLKESIAWQVHSGTLRTLPEDNDSDFFPIPLNRITIRPGAIFVDIGGHALMVSQWDEHGLYAIDGHPDKTVTRKRFSEKAFPYVRGIRTGGFKAFRPVVVMDGEVEPLPNAALGEELSDEQYLFESRGEFYAEMERLIRL